jgi:acetyl-CoA carboxylase biotin carboxyl carrier protein
MKMDKVKEFVEYAKNAGVAELKYESGDGKLSVKLTPDAPVYVQGPAQGAPQAAISAPAASASKGGEAKQSGLLEVTSPFVGTFYRSSSPDSEPYVKPGDRISNGQALCIVEAMKIMNEIESEVSGEIVEICVENETYVEFGQVLFRIKP